MMSSMKIGHATSQSIGLPTAPTNSPAPDASAASLMPEPVPVGDVGMIIAKMVIEGAFATRTQARQDRHRANQTMADRQK
jgi:hypothetical protein